MIGLYSLSAANMVPAQDQTLRVASTALRQPSYLVVRVASSSRSQIVLLQRPLEVSYCIERAALVPSVACTGPL